MPDFVLPNELEVHWRLFIVLYPYITGLVAGAFIVSSLYHVFGKSEFKPVSRIALLSALAFLFGAPLPLLSHLGQPLRAFNIMLTPHLTSAMAGFGYIYSFYLIICLLETYFIYRKDLVLFSQTKRGFSRYIYKIITLGAKDLSPRALHTDHKIVGTLAMIGIPSAAFLHGYVGFIFGSIKANPWWSTPLMPVIFLMSAIVSGMALQILVYAASCKLRRVKLDLNCLISLNKYLWIFLLLASVLEILEVLHMGYEGKEEWEMVRGLILQVIPVTYFGIQMGFGILLPLILLPVGRMKSLPEGIRKGLTVFSGVAVVIGVLAMRFNVVIGGQQISKSFAGYAQFHPSLVANEGILPAALLLAIPVGFLVALVKLLPPWIEEAGEKDEVKESNVVPLVAKWTVETGGK
ncbi:MAG TPA: NrfD/PsrC family molybdoenzyme membrane anchor subunit [Verrucomicrobiae bacterium]|nr:NrfD/PsrC family molybdoenzyme membrane anchor subunit [Verrucomicrobiae bacterium]